MTISSLSNTAALYEIASAGSLQKASQTAQAAAPQQDSAHVSGFAKLIEQLEDLQESDPAKFKEVAGEIATRLEDAAQLAAESGDTRQEKLLNELAAKFKESAETGAMPDLRPPQHGPRGPGGPPPMGPPPDATSDEDEDTASTTTLAASDLTSLLKLFEQNQSEDPMSVLEGVLEVVLSSMQSA